MRILKALIIALLVYALFIFLFFRYFSEIKVPPKEINNHVIKINIKNIPLPPKPVVAQPKIEPVVKKTPVIKKPVTKKVVKKKKKIVKKKPIKKKPIKKKKHIVKKKPAKKKFVKKKVYVPKKKVVKKSKALESFESEMVYMDESMLLPQKKQISKPILPNFSYPNSKIRKLYGSGFHSFTATQKKFIEENLDTIQTITQRILTQRGYPEDAGRTRQAGTNVVSFNLHPNGDISDLHLKTRIGYRALDENTLSLIRVAYMDYPYPSTTTRIVFYVTYTIY